MQIAIIIPCYNEYWRLQLNDFADFTSANPSATLCFVNDGSSDDTKKMLDTFMLKIPEHVVVLHLERNYGKGEAIRRGMKFMLDNHAPECLCYLDADLSSPLQEAIRLINLIDESKGLLCVFGSRVSVFGSKITRLSHRHYAGRIAATMIDMVLNLAIYDTQCGLKVFHSSLAKQIFVTRFISRWLFDVEIFAKLKLLYGLSELGHVMKEIPLEIWTEKGNSKLRLKDVIIIPFLLVSIKWTYRRKSVNGPNYSINSDDISFMTQSHHS